jgi:hypothetical protein
LTGLAEERVAAVVHLLAAVLHAGTTVQVSRTLTLHLLLLLLTHPRGSRTATSKNTTQDFCTDRNSKHESIPLHRN